MPSYRCSECGKRHRKVPMAYRVDLAGLENYDSGAVRFERDGELIVAGDDRFILANIELPVAGAPGEQFVWTCWISLSHASYERMQSLWDAADRENQEPAFGYVSNALPTYEPTTYALKTYVHTRPVGLRPWVELEPTEHPLAVEHREGINPERIAALYHLLTTRTG